MSNTSYIKQKWGSTIMKLQKVKGMVVYEVDEMINAQMLTVAEWILELNVAKEKLRASTNRYERMYLEERIRDLERIIKRKKKQLGIKYK